MAIFNKKNLFIGVSIIILIGGVLVGFLTWGALGWKTAYNFGYSSGHDNGQKEGYDAGYNNGRVNGLSSCIACPPQDLNSSLFLDVWKDLVKNFYDPSRIDSQKMTYGAISGMVNSLNDPYTVFFDPQQTKDFQDEANGTFEGIGAEIDKKNGQIVIVAPLEGTPAQKAGLRPGDQILKIDDTSTADLSSEEAVKLIRGVQGTSVTLTILREGWDAPKEFKITRTVIIVPSLKWELKTAANGDKIAYIKLYQFSQQVSSDFSKAALDVLKSPAKKIILDLRDNPGGYLYAAQDITSWFVKKDSLILVEDFGEGKEKKEYRADGNEKLADFPIVVLINHGSASASEIVAGALRDDRGVKLIGETSFGKGVVQELESLQDGSSLKITVAKWLTPKGTSIIDKGLEPDVKVELTDNDYKEGKDPQLDKALEVIQGIR